MLLYEDILECVDRPMVEREAEEPAPMPKVAPSTGARSSRILIVESDPASLEALREMCGVLGYHADEAASMADAMAYLERSRPKCLLLSMGPVRDVSRFLTAGYGLDIDSHSFRKFRESLGSRHMPNRSRLCRK